MIDRATLDALGRAEFVALLGGVFEHSPWVAEAAFQRRPFGSVEALHRAMCDAVAASSPEAQLALIRAHPQLAGRAAMRGELTEASRGEQRGAGLDQCSAEEFAQLHALNDAYERRFGFPFILAVRGHTRATVLASMAARIDNPPEAEITEALRQVERIARFRLADLVTD
ncbi:MAG TPA: 2-oxo-4-hydroxy-4-carboxy-5-ureidoimidazoline decarboxylase [Candidatus Saccharimonadia bacterium]|nr:2-oxo-4-hydroxy-4-carboxy-5-ureidoimidazoline decarboxylase [Candidatus Saccharimonadia bacterium]